MAVLKKLDRLKRLLPKACIRYLVKYLLINFYRIWIPLYHKVIITRDVHFNEEKVFDGNTEILKCDIKNISLEYLVEIVKSVICRVMIIVLLITYNDTVKDLEWFYKSEGNKKKIRPLKDLVPVWRSEYINNCV